jgi:hypothetical protein
VALQCGPGLPKHWRNGDPRPRYPDTISCGRACRRSSARMLTAKS